MRQSDRGLEILREFFHDQYLVKNLSGNPLLRQGEDIDIGQRAQRDANVEMIDERLTAAGVVMVRDNYEPIPHAEWKVDEILVHTRTGKLARAHVRKAPPNDIPLPGWWVTDLGGYPAGGIADIVHEWRSLKCILAERRHLGLS
jgi:hypothetical protein